MDVGASIIALDESAVPHDITGPQVFEAVRRLIVLRNLVDHTLVEHVSAMDRLGVARKAGGRTRNLLIEMGLPPAVACRMVRPADSLDRHCRTDRQFRDGSMSGEHANAVVRGLGHIESRTGEPLSDAELSAYETRLLAQVSGGATPADVAAHARSIGNQLADDDPAVIPTAEDRALSTLDHSQTPDGRIEVRADLDVVVGEKLVTLIDAWCGGCIKCGAPAAWAHIHHMQHWSDGGATSLDNLCVLCPSCHADVHAMGWEIMLGHDRHPWLIPPASVDRARRPLTAHHRRRMHLDELPGAA